MDSRTFLNFTILKQFFSNCIRKQESKDTEDMGMGSGEGFTVRKCSFYRSPNIVRVIKSRILRWTGHVARMEQGKGAFKILTGTPTRKIPLGRSRRRCEDNIRMDLK